MKDNKNQNALLYRYRIIIFIIIVFVSAFLRFYHISDRFVYIDEYKAVEFALMSPSELLNALSSREPHPPLHYLFIHYWMKMVKPSLFEWKSSSEISDSEPQGLFSPRFILRLPGVIFSIVTLILVYGFASKLYNCRVALASTIIFSLSRFEIFWAQTIRYPSLIMLLGLISTYLFYLFWEKLKGNDFSKMVIIALGYILSTVAGLYTHYYMFLVMLFQNVYFFIKIKDIASKGGSRTTPTRKILLWLLLQIIVVIGFLFWLPILFKQFSITATYSYGVAHSTLSSIPLLLYRFLFMYGLQTYTPVGGILGFICFGVFAFLFIFSIKGNRLIIYLNLFVPIIVVFLLTSLKQLFVEHYFMFCFPAYAIFMGVGLEKVLRLFVNLLIRHKIIFKEM